MLPAGFPFHQFNSKLNALLNTRAIHLTIPFYSSEVVLVTLMSNPQLSSLQHGLIEKDGSASESLYKTDIILLSKEHGDFQVTVKAVDRWGYVHLLTS